MFRSLLLLGAVPFAYAIIVNPFASTFAGGTTSAVYPPPGATGTTLNTYFPDGSEVGFAGPTPTGDEAEAIATAPATSLMESVFPLTDPSPAGPETPGFNLIRSWGNLSPWYSVASQGLPQASPQIPEGCSINQVHLLHRHGARYPTSGSGPASFAAKIHSAATSAGFSATGPLAFLNAWTYKFGAEILTPFGREQMYDLGVGFRVKYGHLLKGFTDLPVFRTTSEARMLDSALNFAAGFFGAQTFQTDYHQSIIIEQPGYNNTLSPGNDCPNSNNVISDYGGEQSDKWIAMYMPPVLDRLAPYIKGVNLTTSDLFSMQQMCAYETVALGFSEFCSLFTEDEWMSFGYANDLTFWYGNGFGNPTAASQGVGWVNELVARLTQTPITGAAAQVNCERSEHTLNLP